MTNFNFTFQPGTSSEQIIGFEMAGRIWSQYLQDDTVFNIHVATTDELPPTVVGGALPTYITTDVETVQLALEQDVTSIDDGIAISNLNTTSAVNGELQYSALLNDTQYQASDLTITQANAKALGLENLVTSNPVDGYILFNDLSGSSFNWDYNFSRTSASSSRQLDFLSMALHELGHIMGFISGVDVIGDINNQANLGQTSLFDLFRYSDRSAEVNARELTPGQDAYFSIDGGQTQLAAMSGGLIEVFGGIEGYQASHWAYQAPANSNLTPEVPEFDLTTALIDLINISAPVTSRDAQLAQSLQLAEFLRTNEVDIGEQTNTTILENARQATYNSLGIMDPALVPGFRSNISPLDLQALDIIGYDLRDSTAFLDYAALLQATQTALAQTVGVDINNLVSTLDTSSFIQDQQLGLSAAITDNNSLFERRRSSVRTRRWTFWQEDGLDPTVVNIVSDGAGELAQITALSNSNQVTTVQAIPYSQLFFRSDTFIGTDISDYIWPLLPSLDATIDIDAGEGDNFVVLGDFAARVTAADGNDTIVGIDSRNMSQAIGNSYTVNAGEGNNYAFLTSESGDVSITAGSGNDYIAVGANNNSVEINGGNNQVYSYGLFGLGIGGVNDLVANAGITDLSLLSTPSNHSVSTGDGNDEIYLLTQAADVTTTGGNNIIHIQGIQNSSITIDAGDGNDEIILVGNTGNIDAGNGNNRVTIGGHFSPTESSTDLFTITTGEGNDTVRLNTVQAIVSTGAGNDVIDLAVGQSYLTTGSGNDLIILGDRQGAYSRLGTQVQIADFSAQDTLLLYGSQEEYQLTSTTLLHQGQLIAFFENGVNFTLESDQLLFTDTSLGANLADAVQAGPDVFEKPLSPLEVDNEERPLQERYDELRNDRPIRYAINGGDDAELFTIEPTTGEVQFKAVPSEQNPLDSDGNSIYDIVVTATLGDGQAARDIDSQRLAITVSAMDFSPSPEPVDPQPTPSPTNPITPALISPTGYLDILGTIGDDGLFGSELSERLVGYGGSDSMWGEGGADLFVIGDSQGTFYGNAGWNDTVYIGDFTPGEDQLLLHGSVNDYSFEVEGSGTRIYSLTDDAIAFLEGVSTLDLNSSSVLFTGQVSAPETTPETPTPDPVPTEPAPTPVTPIPPTSDYQNVLGTDGDDGLFGGETNDLLIGYGGSDSMWGEGGADLFVIGDSQGTFYGNAGWNDTVYIGDFTPGEDQLFLHGSVNDYSFEVEGRGTRIYSLTDDAIAFLEGVTNLDINSSNVLFTDQNSAPDTTSEASVPEPVPTEPVLMPVTPTPPIGNYQDILGTGGDDGLFGGETNDLLIGYGGSDSMWGEGGADLFVIGDSQGTFYGNAGWNDTVYIGDFTPGEDQLVLHGTVNDYSFEVEGSGTRIYSLTDDAIAFLEGVTDIAPASFQYI